LAEPILVLDLEATCWQGPVPSGQQQEVIEIGVCLLDSDSGERSKRRGILVRPERSRVSPFCTALTTLTQDQVDAGIPFAEACDVLYSEYDSETGVWASWGDWDRNMLHRQCASFGVPYPLSERHINAKKLFAQVYRLRRPAGMAAALTAAGRELVGTHHRGEDDAWNIAELLGLALHRLRPEGDWTADELAELTRPGEVEAIG
jgi:inhibitor of KinA sporulation pathway (predicted exonuclease)